MRELCSIGFVPPRGGNQKRVDIFVNYVSHILPLLSGIERLYVESFRLVSMKLTYDISSDLKMLADEARQIESSSTQQFVLGSILKEYAAQLWFNMIEGLSIEEKSTLWLDRVLPIYAEADQLMLTEQDWEGLATSYGIQGNVLSGLGKWEDAIRMLDMDLELVEKYHFSHQKASLHQRLAGLYAQLNSKMYSRGDC